MRMTAYHFFLKHAGSSYNPQTETRQQGRIRGAQALAKAEKWAEDLGLEYVVRGDDRAYCYCDAPTCEYHEGSTKDWETVGVVLYRPCSDHGVECKHAEVLGSLWGIMDPSSEYLRVVKAELALEAMPANPWRR